MFRETPGGKCVLQPSTQKTEPLAGVPARSESTQPATEPLGSHRLSLQAGPAVLRIGSNSMRRGAVMVQVPPGRRAQTLAERRGHLCAEHSPPSTSADSNNPVSKILENILDSFKKQTCIRCTPAPAYAVLTLYQVR